MTLSDLLTRFDEIVEERDGYVVHCPAHVDSKPSLRLTVSDKGKVLFRCRAGCPTPKVADALGLSMRDVATMTAGDLTISPATSQDVPAGAEEVAALAVKLDRWAEALADYATRGVDGGPDLRALAAIEYAERRFGLSERDCVRLGLGYTGGLAGGPRLVVPFRDVRGVARGYQARALDPKAEIRWMGPLSPDGASWAKVGFFQGAAGWDEVLVTEGPGDGLTAVAIGYDAIVIRGAALADNAVVVDEVASIIGDRVAVIAGDGDNAGRKFSSTLASGLSERGKVAKILDVPDGLDLTDWRERDGEAFSRNVVRLVTQATPGLTWEAAMALRNLDAYPLTDLGNARFVRAYIAERGSGVRYSPEAGFFLLDSGVWRPDRLDTTRAYVQETADLVALIANALSRTAISSDQVAIGKAYAAWAKHSQSSRGIDSALRELQALRDVAADVNAFDAHPTLVACRNGVVDLSTGRLSAHDPSLLLTRRIDLDYDPTARAPRWERFLEEVFPAHPDLPAYVQRLTGYGITGSTAEQCFGVLWGTGANGKSVFTDTLTEVFRELTVTTPFSTFEDRGSGGIPNDLAALKGSRLVMAAEGEQGRPMAEAVLKRVTGRDLISARFMRKEFFEFRPTFLLLLATNFKPNFKGQDEGLWRRVKLIPWERYFAPEERDHRLGQDLLAEAQGIFAWAVAGAVEWHRTGLQDPPVVTGATKEYRETSDALVGFLPGVYVRDDTAPGRVGGKELFEAYLEWADEENLPIRERWTRRAFFSAVEERGAVKRHAKAGVAFEGIRRARRADHDAADAAERAETAARAEKPVPADSSPVTHTQPPSSGLSLDDVL